jgi:hypothetical protein
VAECRRMQRMDGGGGVGAKAMHTEGPLFDGSRPQQTCKGNECLG